MGKGMGAVDKNMRKELSLEIDGHACPDQYVNVGIGVEIKFRAPHAIGAMLSPWPRRLDVVEVQRHRRDVVPATAAARWRGGSRRSPQ